MLTRWRSSGERRGGQQCPQCSAYVEGALVDAQADPHPGWGQCASRGVHRRDHDERETEAENQHPGSDQNRTRSGDGRQATRSNRHDCRAYDRDSPITASVGPVARRSR